MQNTTGLRRSLPRLLLVTNLVTLGSVCNAATVIGQWSGNSSLWASSGNFSTIYTALTATGPGGPGYTVTSGQAITQANLSRDNYFVIAGGAASITSAEVSAVANWVRAGGILLLFATGNGAQIGTANNILSALGTGGSGDRLSAAASAANISATSVFTGGALWSPDTAITRPRNISFTPLSWYHANTISGGQALAMNVGDNYNLSTSIRMDRFALGKVYVFGDRFDANALVQHGDNTNLLFFLNLLSQQNTIGQFASASTPEPSSLFLTALGIVVAVLLRKHFG